MPKKTNYIELDKQFYSIEETAEILSVHHQTIRGWIRGGTIKASKIGGQWRISSEEIARLVNPTEVGHAKSAEEIAEAMQRDPELLKFGELLLDVWPKLAQDPETMSKLCEILHVEG